MRWRPALPCQPMWLVAIACFAPLHSLPHAPSLMQRPWPDAVTAVLVQQVQEPAAEREIAAAIPSLTAIDDAVSVKVRDQYEEMPYPRWVRTSSLGQPDRNRLVPARPVPQRCDSTGPTRRQASTCWSPDAAPASTRSKPPNASPARASWPSISAGQASPMRCASPARPAAEHRIRAGRHPQSRLAQCNLRRHRNERRPASSRRSPARLAGAALAAAAKWRHAYRPL